MLRLSPYTQRLFQVVFAPEDQSAAEKILIDECGNNLPFLSGNDEYRMERTRFAAIKLSGGSLDGLRQAILLAKIDWRDLLMSAGFGEDLHAHEKWFADIIARKE